MTDPAGPFGVGADVADPAGPFGVGADVADPAGPFGVAADATDPGLCRDCCKVRRIESAKGATFWLCGAHDEDTNWPKYPPLPVRVCPHFTPAKK